MVCDKNESNSRPRLPNQRLEHRPNRDLHLVEEGWLLAREWVRRVEYA